MVFFFGENVRIQAGPNTRLFSSISCWAFFFCSFFCVFHARYGSGGTSGAALRCGRIFSFLFFLGVDRRLLGIRELRAHAKSGVAHERIVNFGHGPRVLNPPPPPLSGGGAIAE
jgi:hypothetical protein